MDPSPDRPATARTRARVASTAVLALLMAGTCWVVASWVSAWLVPPYLILMALILLPSAGRPQGDAGRGRGDADPADALGPARPVEGPADRSAPEASPAPAGASGRAGSRPPRRPPPGAGAARGRRGRRSPSPSPSRRPGSKSRPGSSSGSEAAAAVGRGRSPRPRGGPGRGPGHAATAGIRRGRPPRSGRGPGAGGGAARRRVRPGAEARPRARPRRRARSRTPRRPSTSIEGPEDDPTGDVIASGSPEVSGVGRRVRDARDRRGAPDRRRQRAAGRRVVRRSPRRIAPTPTSRPTTTGHGPERKARDRSRSTPRPPDDLAPSLPPDLARGADRTSSREPTAWAETPEPEALDEVDGPAGWAEARGPRRPRPTTRRPGSTIPSRPPSPPRPMSRRSLPMSRWRPTGGRSDRDSRQRDGPRRRRPPADALDALDDLRPTTSPSKDVPRGVPTGSAWWPRRLAPRARTRVGHDARAPRTRRPQAAGPIARAGPSTARPPTPHASGGRAAPPDHPSLPAPVAPTRAESAGGG